MSAHARSHYQIAPHAKTIGDAVTASDSVDLPGGITAALIVGVTGNVAVIWADDASNTPVVMYCVAGVEYAWAVRRICSTNTTATSIIALY